MTLTITHQEKYSRGQLILRTLFGAIYIAIPHLVLLLIVGIWSAIVSFLTFWVVLFTGKFPESFFKFQIGYQNWSLRVAASLGNLVDGYPAFFPGGTGDNVKLDVPRPDRVSRGLVILRLLFGWLYVGIPHYVCLIFREIASGVLGFLAWFAILFAGRYPARWHSFNVGTYRWLTRVVSVSRLFHGRISPVQRERVEASPGAWAPWCPCALTFNEHQPPRHRRHADAEPPAALRDHGAGEGRRHGGIPHDVRFPRHRSSHPRPESGSLDHLLSS